MRRRKSVISLTRPFVTSVESYFKLVVQTPWRIIVFFFLLQFSRTIKNNLRQRMRFNISPHSRFYSILLFATIVRTWRKNTVHVNSFLCFSVFRIFTAGWLNVMQKITQGLPKNPHSVSTYIQVNSYLLKMSYVTDFTVLGL